MSASGSLIWLLAVAALYFTQGYNEGMSGKGINKTYNRFENSAETKLTGESSEIVNSTSLSGRTVEIHEYSIADISTSSGRRAALRAKIKGQNLGIETMLLLRGIPKEIKLSAGIYREGIWSVPFKNISSLFLIIPDKYKKSFDVEAFLFKDKESSPMHHIFTVKVR